MNAVAMKATTKASSARTGLAGRTGLARVGALVGIALASLALGCGGSKGSSPMSSELVGTAAVAITDAPADGTCIQVTATGYRKVTSTFTVAPGASSVFTLEGLPLGQVTFTAEAFGGTCPPPAAGDSGVQSVPNWISNAPFTTEVSVAPPALVTLTLVRNGSADVAVNFDDEAGAPTAADAGSSGSVAYMQVPGATGGEVTAQTFLGWFDIDELDVSATVPVTAGATGTGAGAGKASWALTVKLPAQAGTSSLYQIATSSKVLQTVTFDYVSQGAVPSTFYSVVLSNAVVSSVTASGANAGARLELTLTFVFSRIQITFTDANDLTSVGTATQATFDLATNRVMGTSNALPLDFVVGAAAPAGFTEATAFAAPSETSPTTTGSAGTGAGAGTAKFGPASVTLPLGASVLNDLENAVTGRHLASGSVELFTTGSTTPYGTYGFANVILESVSITGTSASVGFEAAKYSWTFGG